MKKNSIRLLAFLQVALVSNTPYAGNVTDDVTTVNAASLTAPGEPRFAGFSNNAVTADVGLAGMHEACSSTFGADARMCLDIEVFKTPGLKARSSVARGWLQPTSYLSGDNPGALSCNGWSVNSGSAATWLTGDMQIIYASKQYGGKRYDHRHYANNHCESQLPVACCK